MKKSNVSSLAKAKSHPDLEVFREEGQIMDVGETDLDKHIGRRVKFIPKEGAGFIANWGVIYHIGEIQRIHDGSLAFRVYQAEDFHLSDEQCEIGDYEKGHVWKANTSSAMFGRPAKPSEVIFLDEE